MDFTEALRIVNLVLCCYLLFKCCMRLTRDWPMWSRRERAVRVHLIAYLFVIAYGTVEQLALGGEFGIRVVMVIVVHVSFLVALLRNRRDPVH